MEYKPRKESLDASSPGLNFDTGAGAQITNDNGEFEIVGLNDEMYDFVASHEGYESQSLMHHEPWRLGVGITLKRIDLYLLGSIHDADTNELIPNVKLKILPYPFSEWHDDLLKKWGNSYTSTENGEFHIGLHQDDWGFTILAQAEGYQPVCKVYEPQRPGRLDGIIIRMNRGLSLTGRVVNTAGSPIPGACIFVGPPVNSERDDYEVGARTQSTEDGSFA